MLIRPLGDRVLVRPIKNPEMSASGLHLPEHRKPEQQGTVVAVGPCSHPQAEDANTLAVALEQVITAFQDGQEFITERDITTLTASALLLRQLVQRTPSVKVGDEVIFSYITGQELIVDDDVEGRYLVMPEAEIMAVLEESHA